MSRTKILHITFNMGFGGTEQVIRQLVTALPAERFHNQILCIDGYVGEIGRQLQGSGIQTIALKRGKGFDIHLVKNIRQIIREQGIDIVHCHQYTPWVYGWMAAWGTKARVVFTEHGRFHPDRYRYKAILFNPFFALTTEAVVAISNATRDALTRYEFLPRRRIQVIYNGLGPLDVAPEARSEVRKALGIASDELLLGTVARLDPVKNQLMMLASFKEVLKIKANTWLLLVGDGPSRQSLESAAEDLGIAERVIFTGFIENPARYLAAMDIFLLSSHTEGTSMTLLEAMNLGIPAVATRVGGNPEIVTDGKTGILTEPNSVQSFSKAMVRLLESPELCDYMAANSRETFRQKFSVETMAVSYAGIYDSACRSERALA